MAHYDATALKAIGTMCGNKLPPASSVQAVFLYEMQRQTEQERLFHGGMFRLARAEEKSEAQNASILELQRQLKTFERQLRSKDVDERLATSRVRMDAQQAKINEQSTRINGQEECVKALEQRIEEVATEHNQCKRVVNSHEATVKSHGYAIEDLKTEVGMLHTAGLAKDAQMSAAFQQIQQLEQNDQQAVGLFQYQNANIQSAYESSESVKVKLATSDAQNLKNLLVTHSTLAEQTSKLEDEHAKLDGDLTALEDDCKALTTLATSQSKEIAALKASYDTLKTSHDSLNQDIGVLFDERDVLITLHNVALARIDKLEGTVRALTGQTLPSPNLSTNGSSSTTSPQKLPVRDPSGKMFDLAVRKGSSLTRYRKADGGDKENVRSIRPFVPGKQWETNGGGREGDEGE